MKDKNQETFIQQRVEGKSINSIAKELNLEIATLKDWDEKLAKEITALKASEYDKLLELHKLDSVNRFSYLCDVYDRLRKELDKRDFSGLPTDKIYYILNDVYVLLQATRDNLK